MEKLKKVKIPMKLAIHQDLNNQSSQPIKQFVQLCKVFSIPIPQEEE